MIFEYDDISAPITIEFLNGSGENYIIRTYYRNKNIYFEIPYKNGNMVRTQYKHKAN